MFVIAKDEMVEQRENFDDIVFKHEMQNFEENN